MCFPESGVEYAVLETGLGGRLDATQRSRAASCLCDHVNRLMTICSILETHFRRSQQRRQGSYGRVCLSFMLHPRRKATESLKIQRRKTGASVKKIGKDAYEILGIEDKHIAFSCFSDYYGNTTWKLNNTGIYQPGNAMLAIGSDEIPLPGNMPVQRGGERHCQN